MNDKKKKEIRPLTEMELNKLNKLEQMEFKDYVKFRLPQNIKNLEKTDPYAYDMYLNKIYSKCYKPPLKKTVELYFWIILITNFLIYMPVILYVLYKKYEVTILITCFFIYLIFCFEITKIIVNIINYLLRLLKRVTLHFFRDASIETIEEDGLLDDSVQDTLEILKSVRRFYRWQGYIKSFGKFCFKADVKVNMLYLILKKKLKLWNLD